MVNKCSIMLSVNERSQRIDITETAEHLFQRTTDTSGSNRVASPRHNTRHSLLLRAGSLERKTTRVLCGDCTDGAAGRMSAARAADARRVALDASHEALHNKITKIFEFQNVYNWYCIRGVLWSSGISIRLESHQYICKVSVCQLVSSLSAPISCKKAVTVFFCGSDEPYSGY